MDTQPIIDIIKKYGFQPRDIVRGRTYIDCNEREEYFLYLYLARPNKAAMEFMMDTIPIKLDLEDMTTLDEAGWLPN